MNLEPWTLNPARARTQSAHSGVERANHEATTSPSVFPTIANEMVNMYM